MIKYDYRLYQDKIVEDLCDLLAIPSVNRDQPLPDMPFGKDVEKGFQWVRDKAIAFGFDVTEFDGYALQIDIGSGKHVVGMLCHVDVVPAGEGWDTDPFQGIITDNKIYGRGTVDDKGPLVCCLYAAKYLRDSNLIPDDTRIRLIVGGDEEREWRDIKYYNDHAEAPEISFAADGMFPLVFGEKGLIDFDYAWTLKRGGGAEVRLISFAGGMARNSVPASAEFVLGAKDIQGTADILRSAAAADEIKASVSVNADKIKVKVEGKGSHAMFPERGINAVSKAVKLLASLGRQLDCYDFAEAYEKCIGDDYSAGRFGCACSDTESGSLTFNVGQLMMEGDKLRMLLGIRYPVSVKYDGIAACIARVAGEIGCEMKTVDHMEPIYFKRDDEVVMLLEKAYRDVSGDTVSEPFTVGAATFARTMKNTVAFGPIFPGQAEMSHQPNEFIAIRDLNMTTEIYINALYNLANRGK